MGLNFGSISIIENSYLNHPYRHKTLFDSFDRFSFQIFFDISIKETIKQNRFRVFC